MKYTLAAILYKEEDMYVALCPELDIASQGNTIEKAKNSLRKAVPLFERYLQFILERFYLMFFLKPMRMTQSELVKKLGVNFRTIHDIVNENERRGISLEMTCYTRFTDLTPSFLIFLSNVYNSFSPSRSIFATI